MLSWHRHCPADQLSGRCVPLRAASFERYSCTHSFTCPLTMPFLPSCLPEFSSPHHLAPCPPFIPLLWATLHRTPAAFKAFLMYSPAARFFLAVTSALAGLQFVQVEAGSCRAAAERGRGGGRDRTCMCLASGFFKKGCRVRHTRHPCTVSVSATVKQGWAACMPV